MEKDERFDKLRYDVLDFLILNQKEQIEALRRTTNELHDVTVSLRMIVDELAEKFGVEKAKKGKDHRTDVLLKFYEPL